jgi:hypothetical protein
VHSVSLRNSLKSQMAGGSKQFVAVALSVFGALNAATISYAI